MSKYSRKTQRELLKEQLKITGQLNEFREIVKEGMIENILLDDSFANVMRLLLFAQGADEEEELLILLNFSREKLHRMLK